MEYVLTINSIDVFHNISTRRQNDKHNKIREKIILAIGNRTIPEEYLEDDRWINLTEQLQNFESINSPENYESVKWIKKAGRRYNWDFDLEYYDNNNEKISVRFIEFKYNVRSLRRCPQFVSPTNPSRFIICNETFEDYYYNNYLPQVCERMGIELPPREEYINQINSNQPECVSDIQEKYYRGCRRSSQYSENQEDIDFYNFCKTVSRESIRNYLDLYDLDIPALNVYLGGSQNNKEYMLYKDGRIYHEVYTQDDYTIDPDTIIKRAPYFRCKTLSGKDMKILLRWKNGNGVAFPAFQIS